MVNNCRESCRVRGQKCTSKNNFETISIHYILRRPRRDSGSVQSSVLLWAERLIRASSRPYVLVLNFDGRSSGIKTILRVPDIVQKVDSALGIAGRKQECQLLDELIDVWVCEDRGNSLRWDRI